LVENKVIIDVKSKEKVAPVDKKQVLTYLRFLDKRLGMLINLGEEVGQGRNLANRQRTQGLVAAQCPTAVLLCAFA
jgi:GxxExxY protein